MTGVLADVPPLGEPWICVKCTATRGAHYLTCPMLRLESGWNETCPPPPDGGASTR